MVAKSFLILGKQVLPKWSVWETSTLIVVLRVIWQSFSRPAKSVTRKDYLSRREEKQFAPAPSTRALLFSLLFFITSSLSQTVCVCTFGGMRNWFKHRRMYKSGWWWRLPARGGKERKKEERKRERDEEEEIRKIKVFFFPWLLCSCLFFLCKVWEKERGAMLRKKKAALLGTQVDRRRRKENNETPSNLWYCH